MINNPIPKATVKDSPLTTSPQTGAVATMDDAVYTMDDSEVMMGGEVTIYSNIRVKTGVPKIRTSVRKRR